MEKLDDDELEIIRQRRVDEIKKSQNQKNLWQISGHGEFSEISNEKEFFEAGKKSERVVCHFYDNTNLRCKIIDKILTQMAEKHLETKFIKVKLEKVPFLVKRLNIQIVPTLALIKNGKAIGYLRANGPEEPIFSSIEDRILASGVIFGTKKGPEGPAKSQVKIIRDAGKQNDSDDDDW